MNTLARSHLVLVALVASAVLGASCSSANTTRGGATDTSSTTSTSSHRVSLASARAALIPLSEMPTGTAPIKFLGAGKDGSSCLSAKPPAAPLAMAEVGYARGPFGARRQLPLLFETVSLYSKGTAPQRLSDLRILANCRGSGTTTLQVPRLAADQASYQADVPDVGRFYLLFLRVRESAIVSVYLEFPYGDATAQLVSFARKAYLRAESMLGG